MRHRVGLGAQGDAQSTLPVVGPALVVVVLTVSVGALAAAMEFATYNVWGAFWVGPTLILLTVPVANRVARTSGDAKLGRLVLFAAAVKVIGGSLVRYWIEFGLYGGNDAARYHDVGSQLAPLLRSGAYDGLGKISGTRFTEVLTGQIYALIGPTRLGGFMVFSWLAFIGLFLFWRAFSLAVPHGDSRRYALLVFFFPTLLIWTSATGKDAWMILCLGAAAWGFALLLRGGTLGVIPMAAGLWGAAVVRPHLVLILLAAALLSLPLHLVARRTDAMVAPRRGTRLLLVGVLALAAVLAVGQAESFFKLDELDAESAESVTERVAENTGDIGQSRFVPPSPDSPMGYAASAVTVLLRPFPFEVANAQGLASSAEGLVLVALVLMSLRRLVRLPKALLSNPYVAFAFAYTAAFIYAFASISNFGILVRQRAQVLPLIFVLLAIEARVVSRDSSDETSSAASEEVPKAVHEARDPLR